MAHWIGIRLAIPIMDEEWAQLCAQEIIRWAFIGGNEHSSIHPDGHGNRIQDGRVAH